MLRRRVTVSLLALWLLGGVACIDPETFSPAPDAGPPPARPPDCLRLPETIDFGEIEIGGRGDAQFFLNNNTLKTLEIEIGRLSEPFFVSVVGTQLVKPGVPFPLRLSFLPPDGRSHVETFEFRGGTNCETQRVALTGIGAGGLIVTNFFDFGPIPIAQPETRRLTVTNSRRVAVDVTATLSGPAFSAPSTFTIPALGAIELELGATAITSGLFNGTLELSSNEGDHRLVGLAASGGVPQLRLNRTAIDIERLPFPETAPFPMFQRELVLTNDGDGPLRIDGIAVRADPGSEVDELRPFAFTNTVLPRGNVTVLINFVPRRVLGSRSWTLRFTTNQPNQPVFEVPVTAEVSVVPLCPGTFMPAPLSVPASSLPQLAQITIDNPFTVDCLLDDVHLDPPIWQLTSSDQLTVPALSSVQLGVQLDRLGTSTLTFNVYGGGGGYLRLPVSAQ